MNHVVDGLGVGGAGAKEKDADQNSQRFDAPPAGCRKDVLHSNLQIQSLLASAGVYVHQEVRRLGKRRHQQPRQQDQRQIIDRIGESQLQSDESSVEPS